MLKDSVASTTNKNIKSGSVGEVTKFTTENTFMATFGYPEWPFVTSAELQKDQIHKVNYKV